MLPKKLRTVGVESRGEGPYALLAAIVLQAAWDRQHDHAAVREEAEEWLRSEDCAWVLLWLDVPHPRFLEALEGKQLRRGTSTRAFWEDEDDA